MTDFGGINACPHDGLESSCIQCLRVLAYKPNPEVTRLHSRVAELEEEAAERQRKYTATLRIAAQDVDECDAERDRLRARVEELEGGERPPSQEDVELSRRQRDAAQKEVMGERDRLRTRVKELETEPEAERLVGLLYTLLRDAIPPGRLEVLVRDEEENPPPYKFSNPHLEAYARELAQRVLADPPKPCP